MLRPFFWSMTSKKMTKKWPEPKNLKYKKISFFMPVNHAKKFLKSVHTVAFFWWLFSETLNFYFFSVPVICVCYRKWPIGPLYYREFLAKYAKFRQQIWAVRQGINPRDKNQKQANFCSQVEGQLRTPYGIKALWIHKYIASFH